MEISLVSRIFRAGSEIKNRALLYKGFRKPKSGARINKDTNEISLAVPTAFISDHWPQLLPDWTEAPQTLILVCLPAQYSLAARECSLPWKRIDGCIPLKIIH